MRVAIIGTGGMGSWFAKEFLKTEEVAVYDTNKIKMTAIKNAKHLNSLSDLQLFNPEFLLNAVRIQNTIEVFESAAKYINRDCIISDIASIKEEIPDYYLQCPFPFASFHPMFGPQFADLNQVKEENVIIIAESDTKAKKFLKTFFNRFNFSIF